MTEDDEMVTWTAEAAAQLAGSEAETWLDRIEYRYPAILRTLDHFSTIGSEAGLRIAINLTEFWIQSHRSGRGRYLLERMLPTAGMTTLLRVRALRALARLHEADNCLVRQRETLRAADEILAGLSIEPGTELGTLEFSSEPEGGGAPMNDIEELITWTAQAEMLVSGPDKLIWMARIKARLSDILQTFAYHQSRPGDQRDGCLRILINLEQFWILSVRTMQALEWLRRLLPSSPHPTALRADMLLCRGRLQLAELRFADAVSAALEAGQIYRELGNAAGVSSAFDLYFATEGRTKPPGERVGGEAPPLLDILALAEWIAEAATHLSGPDQEEWLARIDEREAEIVFAIHPGIVRWNDRAQSALRIAIDMSRYWWMRGRAERGRSALNDLLVVADRLTPLYADGLLALAGLEYAQTRYADVKRACEQACAIYRTLENRRGVAASLNQLGMAEREAGDLGEAHLHHAEAMAHYSALGDERGAVACQSNLGVVALFSGDLDAAQRLHEAALAERQRLGDVRGIASSLGSLGTIARLRNDPELAQERHEEALAMRRELGDPWGVAGSLLNLGLVAIQRGDLPTAGDLLGQATVGFVKVGDRLGVCETLDARALLTFAEDLPAEAVRLFAVASTARKEVGAPLPPVYRREVEKHLEKCKARLGAKAFDAAWTLGLSAQYSPFPLDPSEVP
jgi:tetratricopeptide (TPR) repeat protein